MVRIQSVTILKKCTEIYRKGFLIFDAVKFQESIFALPFAYSGMLLSHKSLPNYDDFIWVTLAMIGARTIGMSANRIIDHNIDLLNPRTANRHLPKKLLRARDLWVLSLLALIIFLISSWKLNNLCLILAPFCAIYMLGYPFAKRLTWAGSFFLGWTLAIAPSAGWIAMTSKLSWEPVILSCAVASWATSFDILYHTQDHKFYINHGLHSVTQKFGIIRAFKISMALDILSVFCLISLGLLMELSAFYFIGCVATMFLLAYRRRMISPTNLSRINIAFMRINAYISITMLIAIGLPIIL